MKTITWAMLAALMPMYPNLAAFDLDLSNVPEPLRHDALVQELFELRQPQDASQIFARMLGFSVNADGLTLSDDDAAARAYALAVVIEDETYEARSHDAGPLAAAIGYERMKDAEKNAPMLAELATLASAALGLLQPGDEMPRPGEAAIQAVRTRILRPVLAAA